MVDEHRDKDDQDGDGAAFAASTAHDGPKLFDALPGLRRPPREPQEYRSLLVVERLAHGRDQAGCARRASCRPPARCRATPDRTAPGASSWRGLRLMARPRLVCGEIFGEGRRPVAGLRLMPRRTRFRASLFASRVSCSLSTISPRNTAAWTRSACTCNVAVWAINVRSASVKLASPPQSSAYEICRSRYRRAVALLPSRPTTIFVPFETFARLLAGRRAAVLRISAVGEASSNAGLRMLSIYGR